MVTYYLAKTVSTATSEKKYRQGEVETYMFGKGNHILYARGTFNGWHDTNLLTPFFVEEYGYTSESSARRNWSYRHPENSTWWTTDVEIVPIRIDSDSAGHKFIV